MDIITTVFRVVRNYQMDEILKLEFIKVKTASTSSRCTMSTSRHAQCRVN